MCYLLVLEKREFVFLCVSIYLIDKSGESMAKALNDDDPVYVAVSEDVDESRSTLLWALRTLRVKKLHLLHVYQLISMTPSSSGLEQSEIDAIQELEQTSRNDTLLKYHDICIDEGQIMSGNGLWNLSIKTISRSLSWEQLLIPTTPRAWFISHLQKLSTCSDMRLIAVTYGLYVTVISSKRGSAHSYSESSSSLHSLDSAPIPYGGAGRAERVTQPHALSSSEELSARGFESMYYEEQRRRLEIDELKREKKQRDKMRREAEDALSSSFGVSQILYNEEVIRRREVEAELNRAKAEIEDMKRVQKELEEQHYADCRLLEMFQKERDEAIKTTEELLRALEKGESSIPLQWSVSNEPPQCFICPISKDIMQNPHVAADGYTYEADEFRRWLNHGGEKSPMTNIRLQNHNLTPNLVLRSAIKDWLQQHP
ncbi:U-box domain-containing protein 56 isoform X3 [Arabidopsis lyrata subsp. lyrata]|uniref:U-box domain-containing protein 56 isoform X3 n=1 Tax=Arabidopsis lyrata subsp. lyrata TaxID=81972 RepID=UPI000A29C05C|nr:U-box domain-containing protein 56 isoform X3 [Arabidopsis lyrata subsp. lyrata]|eukprot:XP_020869669.1 U-box domain-containing protein 56 isoform X3 [Arabidopsis lyrata subsp. lyrata]